MPDPKATSVALRSTVTQRIGRLQQGVLADDARAVATLARLRRADPANPGADPAIWELTLADLPDALAPQTRSDAPTPAEAALHAALTLYAVHQQSQRVGVHEAGVPFGAAVGRLARARGEGDDLDEGVLKRLHQAILATEFSAKLMHLRALVQLMRAEDRPPAFDYGRFADDLMTLADRRRDDTRVSVRWGRDLYARPTKTTPDSEETP